MIRLRCPSCGKKYALPAESRGKQATCKDCGTRFSIQPGRQAEGKSAPADPRPKSSGTRQKRKTSQAEAGDPRPQSRTGDRQPGKRRSKKAHPILDGFRGEFSKPRVTLGHRFMALIVACAMLVLPVLYLAFIAGVGQLTWWHATHNYMWMRIPGPKIIALVLYVGLIIGGVVWICSLIRPLFMGLFRPEEEQGGLRRKDEPLLFEFTDRLADEVGSPRPEMIYLSLSANASAYFRSKAFGLGRRSFTLTLGVPLVAGLTLEQLASVMAHEFGHFSQGSLVLDRLIQRVNTWFGLAVYRRGAMDNLIASLWNEENQSILLTIVGFSLWVLLILGRGVLWMLMCLGLIVSMTLLRRLEFNADRYSLGVIGTQSFKEATKQIVALNVAHDAAWRHVFNRYHAQYLPDDFAEFTVSIARRSGRLKKRTNRLIRRQKPNWLSTHPPTEARIAAAKRLDLPGIFQSSLPGKALFHDFYDLSSQVSRMLYELRYGPDFGPGKLIPTDEAVDAFLSVSERP